MDTSRQVPQSPAETSDSGYDFPSYCPICAGGSWVFDRFPEGDPAVAPGALKIYQWCIPAKALGEIIRASCISCVTRDERAQAPARIQSITELVDRNMRDVYLAQLVFAARDLARSRVTDACSYVGLHGYRRCEECFAVLTREDHLDHLLACRTGRVLRVIQALLEIPPNSHERRSCEENSSEQLGSAVPRAPQTPSGGDFGEPWYIEPEGTMCMELRRADGKCVVDPYGSMLEIEEDEPYLKRIEACINACVGISTQMLQTLPPRHLEAILRAQGEGDLERRQS